MLFPGQECPKLGITSSDEAMKSFLSSADRYYRGRPARMAVGKMDTLVQGSDTHAFPRFFWAGG